MEAKTRKKQVAIKNAKEIMALMVVYEPQVPMKLSQRVITIKRLQLEERNLQKKKIIGRRDSLN